MSGAQPLEGMRVVYAGTPEFAAVALRALLAAGALVPLVLTQPDRPAGRGMRLLPGAVKQVALQHALPVVQPRGLRLDGRWADDAALAREALRQARPDVMVVAAYGLILPQWVLDLPYMGCVNIHASLLPRWRGAAPIQRAIEAGDAITGVSIMRMDVGLDTGPVYRMEDIAIDADDTAATLHDKLAALGAHLLPEVLDDMRRDVAEPTAQSNDGITYAGKLDKAESWLDWTQPATLLARRVRAFNPAPGTQTTLDGQMVKVLAATAVLDAGKAAPGVVVSIDARGIVVACGTGALALERLQKAGGKPLEVPVFLQGHPLTIGTMFGVTVL